MVKRMVVISAAVISAVIFICGMIYAMCGMCEAVQGQGANSVYDKVAKGAAVKDGVKEITYNQFMKIRNSKEGYVLLDVLSPESYAEGHIDGARSFPVNTINKASAGKALSKGAKTIVYCGSFQCTASTAAAKKLSALGYNVVDYKGGLKEWQEKGNALVK